MTLELASDALARKLLEFRDHAEQAEERLEELRESIEDYEEELGDDWSSFTEAVESLLRVVEEHSGKLDPQGDEAGGAVEQVATLTQQVKESVEDSLEANEEILNSLKDQAAGAVTDVERLVAEAVETPAEGVVEQLGNAAQGATETAAGGVDTITNGFVKQAQETVDLSKALVDGSVKMLTDGGTWVKQAVLAWTAKLTEVEDKVALEGFKKAEEHVTTVVDYAIDECTNGQQAALTEVEQMVEAARQELQSLVQALEESEGTLSSSGERLDGAAEGFVSAIAEAHEGLDRVTEILHKYRAM